MIEQIIETIVVAGLATALAILLYIGGKDR